MPSLWGLRELWLSWRGPPGRPAMALGVGGGDGSLYLHHKVSLSLLHIQLEMSGGRLEFLVRIRKCNMQNVAVVGVKMVFKASVLLWAYKEQASRGQEKTGTEQRALGYRPV